MWGCTNLQLEAAHKNPQNLVSELTKNKCIQLNYNDTIQSINLRKLQASSFEETNAMDILSTNRIIHQQLPYLYIQKHLIFFLSQKTLYSILCKYTFV